MEYVYLTVHFAIDKLHQCSNIPVYEFKYQTTIIHSKRQTESVIPELGFLNWIHNNSLLKI